MLNDNHSVIINVAIDDIQQVVAFLTSLIRITYPIRLWNKLTDIELSVKNSLLVILLLHVLLTFDMAWVCVIIWFSSSFLLVLISAFCQCCNIRWLLNFITNHLKRPIYYLKPLFIFIDKIKSIVWDTFHVFVIFPYVQFIIFHKRHNDYLFIIKKCILWYSKYLFISLLVRHKFNKKESAII